MLEGLIIIYIYFLFFAAIGLASLPITYLYFRFKGYEKSFIQFLKEL